MRKLLIAVALVAMGASLAHSAALDKQSFFTELRHKLERVIPARKTVRSGEGVSPDELYWKGVKREASVGDEEYGKFRSALDLALQGKDAEAAGAFEVFAREFPESPLRKDAEDALGLLKPAEEPKPAEPEPEEPEPSTE